MLVLHMRSCMLDSFFKASILTHVHTCRQPELSFVLRCADLCEDFQEDLHFHFSLGLSSVLVGTCQKHVDIVLTAR